MPVLAFPLTCWSIVCTFLAEPCTWNSDTPPSRGKQPGILQMHPEVTKICSYISRSSTWVAGNVNCVMISPDPVSQSPTVKSPQVNCPRVDCSMNRVNSMRRSMRWPNMLRRVTEYRKQTGRRKISQNKFGQQILLFIVQFLYSNKLLWALQFIHNILYFIEYCISFIQILVCICILVL